ncbi:MAG: type IV pilus twitching motility protein PilT [Bdellovibrionaceae bacterium]|nr:type IV pilus twitching motility protein PilT [Pseudobdellovibrionaceae bacterium]
MDLNEILKQAAELGASDIHLKVGLVPVIRKFGMLRPLNAQAFPITAEHMEKMVQASLTPEELRKLADKLELDKGMELKGIARFRVNVFRQRGTTRFVIRVINQVIPTIDELNLPQTVKYISEYERGLVLVTGVTGSGKSTTLASMVNHINQTKNLHIITLEDPIEYLIKDRKSIVSQRELGIDMHSFAESLRATLRQDPDVILLGEMRDRETIETALLAAETGHLVFSTLHTMDAQETINRIIAQFPPHQHEQMRRQLAAVLKAVISQRLVARKDGTGLIPATEILVNNQRIKEMIEDPEKTSMISSALETSAKESGMRSFDQSLLKLVAKGYVSLEEALTHSSNPDNFNLKVKGIQSGVQSDWQDNIETSTTINTNWKKESSKLEIDKKTRT